MKTRALCGLLVAAVLTTATGCGGGFGNDPDSSKTTAAGAGRGIEVPGVGVDDVPETEPTGDEIPGVEPTATRTTEPTDREIPGVEPRPTRIPCSNDSRWAIPACIDDALEAERAALESTGDEQALDDLDGRSEDLDGLEGYDWQSDEARDLYERAKSLDATG